MESIVVGGKTSEYNATVYCKREGRVTSIFVATAAEINGRLQMLRSNAVTCTGYEDKLDDDGNSRYDAYVRATHPEDKLEIVLDNRAGYESKARGMFGSWSPDGK